jgi:hypothetical protein
MLESAGEEDLPSKVGEWLNREGYPLEYYVAHTFRRAHFSVEQGAYIKHAEGEPREVDVLASMSQFQEDQQPFARIYTVAECKWTKSKPWVAFTTDDGQMASSAIIAQTLGSALGEAAIYLEVGEKKLQELPLFHSPDRPCFGGRQAFSKDSDVFYNAIRSVAGAARNLADSYNVYRGKGDMPKAAVLTFPLIVIDGDLFEASYQKDADQMRLERVPRTRLHWRGSKESSLRTTVDVVTKAGLEAYVERVAEDTEVLLKLLFSRANELVDCFLKQSTEGLAAKNAATGTSGMPAFLQDLYERAERAKRSALATERIRRHTNKSKAI